MIELDLAVRLADFELRVKAKLESRFIAVMGRSGSGKTSLLEAIAGLRPARGRIAIDGEVLLDSAAGTDLPPERRRVGYVPQDALLFPHLTAGENLSFGRGTTWRSLEEAAVMLELDPLLDRHPSTLSGGERQRVALGRALAISPRLLLLDEPLAALDVELKERIIPYLLKVRDLAKVPLFYVTHNLGEAWALADEALVLERGEVIFRGSPRGALDLGALRKADPSATFENVLDGTIRGGRLEVEKLRLSVPASGIPEGARAAYAVPAEDVLVSTQPLTGISARNVLEATLTSLEGAADEVLVRADASGVPFVAKLTSDASSALGLAAGQRVFLVVKTHSFRRLH
ncbi:MAG: molybdenum ABC transporter ATP-binding protein [Myxococcales bacterium]|nr:molybdenum ABC transporter ATP-binding protein [Myxococcales bacterium]